MIKDNDSFLYTSHTEDRHIVENADIEVVNCSKEKFIQHLNETGFLESDYSVVDLEIRSFGDCWSKTTTPEQFWDEEKGAYFIDSIECSCLTPEQHSGMAGYYWFTLKQDVYIPVLFEAEY
jgi:hypothetical protein